MPARWRKNIDLIPAMGVFLFSDAKINFANPIIYRIFAIVKIQDMETAVAYTNTTRTTRLTQTRKTRPVHDDIDLDNDELNAQVEAGLENFFARQRELMEGESLPEGCISLEESYRNSINRLNERYA